MIISELIRQLEQKKKVFGDIEVTCTGTILPEDNKKIPDVFETTVETLIFLDKPKGILKERVRLFL